MLFRSDRKSTRLNSSHTLISYAVFCLKKKHPLSRAHTAPGTERECGPARRGRARAPTDPGNTRDCRASRPVVIPSDGVTFFFLMMGRPPRSTLFPSPPLFRSDGGQEDPLAREPVGVRRVLGQVTLLD